MNDVSLQDLFKHISVAEFVYNDCVFQVLFVFNIPRAIFCGYSCYLVLPGLH